MEHCETFNTMIKLSRQYWKVRTSGELGEIRTIAHNALMDGLNNAGIHFEDREDAAKIGLICVQREALLRSVFILGVKEYPKNVIDFPHHGGGE